VPVDPSVRAALNPDGARVDKDRMTTSPTTDRAIDAIAVLREALAETAAALAADERRVDGALADYLDRAAA
jgi:hypothetical protein